MSFISNDFSYIHFTHRLLVRLPEPIQTNEQ